jgi:sortase A
MVWTAIVLLIISFVWIYQDVQARWEALEAKPTQIAAIMPPGDDPGLLASSTPPIETPTPASSPTTIPTPAPTKLPTETATYVLGPAGVPPDILPETPLDLETTPTPTPTPEKEIVPPTYTPTPIPDPAPTNTPEPAPPPLADSGPTRVLIKSVGIDTPLMPVGWYIVEQNGRQYSVWDVADFAGGWHETSALPGQPGNTVLSGHHNIKGEVFRYLVDVQEGDEIVVYVGETPYRYYVEQKLIVKEKGEPVEVRRQNARWIAPTNDVRLTLVTCWPYTNNTHRVIVVAKPSS